MHRPCVGRAVPFRWIIWRRSSELAGRTRRKGKPSRPAGARSEATAPAPRADRVAVLQPQCLEDLSYWAESDTRVAARILRLMREVLRDPFRGIGKPEPLKWKPNTWSRRISEVDRLVYLVRDDRIDFLQARYHYGD